MINFIIVFFYLLYLFNTYFVTSICIEYFFIIVYIFKMNNFLNSDENSPKLIIGTLSGTSVDSIDIALIKISGYGINTKLDVINYSQYPFSGEIKSFILKCSSPELSNVSDICKLNFILGRLFADKINTFIRESGYSNSDIYCIGSHGQTIYHNPSDEKYFGYSEKSTLQIGDPSVIANLTDIVTVGDFRCADVAVEGSGAPLVPYLDFILFNTKDKNKMLVNLGGIANITYLKADCKIDEVIAFDTGPGNMIIDSLARKLFNKEFDYNGEIASSGKLSQELFDYICSIDIYYKADIPKSTGREYYGDDFVNRILTFSEGIKENDILNTISEYTVFCIYSNYRQFIDSKGSPDEILLSGGGASNNFFVNTFSKYFPESNIQIINESGITSDNKEAVLFAVLANETILGNYSNIKNATGAKKNVISGKICLV